MEGQKDKERYDEDYYGTNREDEEKLLAEMLDSQLGDV